VEDPSTLRWRRSPSFSSSRQSESRRRQMFRYAEGSPTGPLAVAELHQLYII
jgi:hypothetical protein